MSWQTRVPHAYTRGHIKVMQILQRRHVVFVTEQPILYNLDNWHGGHVVADIFLPEYDLRVECDDPYFHRKRMDEANDLHLLGSRKIRTLRLINNSILRVDGEKYVLDMLKNMGVNFDEQSHI